MTAALVHRLELAEGADLAIDHALLDWLADVVGLGRTPVWLVHVRCLTGDLSGAFGILDQVFPDADYTLRRVAGDRHRATVQPAGATVAFAGEAREPANALLAAVLRAHDACALSICFTFEQRAWA
ncbi:hypothetical protein [Aureimonas sp. D3]|uniref:hypothetical protein n=1 Tax=Aureimonas sp. D3 TaxID=1638164 RepID=UPI000785B7C9|nr:hypothetical protein [Aureimonas sp. D3]